MTTVAPPASAPPSTPPTVLARVGLLPFVPHLWHHWDKAHPAPYETWIRRCLAMLTRCDAVLRLDGESPGADREVAAALAIGMPVYRSITALILDVGVELPAREPHWVPPPEQSTPAFVAAFNAVEPAPPEATSPATRRLVDMLEAAPDDTFDSADGRTHSEPAAPQQAATIEQPKEEVPVAVADGATQQKLASATAACLDCAGPLVRPKAGPMPQRCPECKRKRDAARRKQPAPVPTPAPESSPPTERLCLACDKPFVLGEHKLTQRAAKVAQATAAKAEKKAIVLAPAPARPTPPPPTVEQKARAPYGRVNRQVAAARDAAAAVGARPIDVEKVRAELLARRANVPAPRPAAAVVGKRGAGNVLNF
jgi:hypothetical protein